MPDLAAPLRRIVEIFGIGTAITFEDHDRAARLIRGYVDGVLSDLQAVTA